ncbi:hypothetical protein T492DRAFT_947864, partial [Pavlovales sp. CCMP2436]
MILIITGENLCVPAYVLSVVLSVVPVYVYQKSTPLSGLVVSVVYMSLFYPPRRTRAYGKDKRGTHVDIF